MFSNFEIPMFFRCSTLCIYVMNVPCKFCKWPYLPMVHIQTKEIKDKKANDHIYPTPPLGQDMRQGQFFKRSLAGLNTEFSFSWTSCLTKAEEPSLPYYLPIAGGRIIGFIPLPRVLVLCEMQSVLSRNWTRITVSISCDDNYYTTGTSKKANNNE